MKSLNPLDRTIIRVPYNDHLVIIYNKYQEVKQLEKNQRWYQEDGYIAKPLAIIPELDLEIYSRCIACRINDNGEFESIQDEDYSIIFKYFYK